MTQALIALSASISRLVASSAPLVCAIRIGANRHVTGLVCQGDTIVTTDQALPVLDSYTVVLSNRVLIAARAGPRDPGANIAILRLETPWPAVNPEIAEAAIGNLLAVIGTDADASPTVRLTVVHRFYRTDDGPIAVLDLSGDRVEPGSVVIDAGGRLVGMASVGTGGEAIVVPSPVIGRMLMPDQAVAPAVVAAPVPLPGRRGWLGVALQPITVPEQLAGRVGQSSGRMVVSLTKSGPAEKAGMRVGDVLLALNGHSASGPHAFRAFLGCERIGTQVEVKLLRDGTIVTTSLVVAEQPG